MTRHVIGHICGHPTIHHVADYAHGSRELLDMAQWHDWLHGQPCLECSRPAGLPAVAADPTRDRLIQAAMASMKVRGAKERPETTQKITHSRFTTTPSSVWDNAGITLRQAMLLEYLFLMPSGRATYKDLADQYDTSPINVGRSVGALARRGMVRRVGEQAVTVDRAAWRLRITYAAWDAWLTAETRQTAHERYGLLR